MEPAATLDNAQLCTRFDCDILYDAHGLNIRIGRSQAATKLIVQGGASLPAIVAHLRSGVDLDQVDLREAWGRVLNAIQHLVEPTCSAPGEFSDTAAWLGWADQYLTGI